MSRHLILDADTHEHKLRDREFTFIELPKFYKSKEELQTLTEKRIYFVKNAEESELIPPDVDDQGLMSACEEADKHT